MDTPPAIFLNGTVDVLAGVIEASYQRARYEQALATPVVVVRLVARPEVVSARIAGRYADPARRRHLAWHQHRAPELATILDRAGVDDHVVDVSDLAPREAGRAVLRLTRDEG